MTKMALVLGGGAPNCTLMTGAMLAFDEAGVKFDVISGAGGGGAMALMYASPADGLSRQENLRNSINLSVSDAIFNVLPINYRVFVKGSRIAEMYRGLLTKLPFYEKVVNQYGMSKGKKLMSDLIQLIWAITTPSTTSFFSSGLCSHAPLLEQFIDFSKIKDFPEEVYLNAYSIADQKVVVYDKSEINFETFGASLGYPFIYEAVDVNGIYFMEGGAVDTYNFSGLLETDEDIRTLVVLDAFGNQNYIQRPKNLFQAYSQSMILPLVEVCRKDLMLFEHYYLKEWNAAHPKKEVELVKIRFDIPPDWLPAALDWSTSNMERMFELGYDTAKKHIAEFGVDLGRTIS
ncbi:patatin-like phospholipase family protein [Paramagnetospirillum caucaseum]|nr:patatin-like phospholipase family protein [Paramagnetospirillum caucaseum]